MGGAAWGCDWTLCLCGALKEGGAVYWAEGQ